MTKPLFTSPLTFILTLTALTLVACSSSTERGASDVDRRQMLLIPSEQIVGMSAEAYEQTKAEAAKKGQLDKNPQQVARVNSIAKRVVPHTAIFRKDAPGWAWETHVISSPEINAYCMPGGKIIFYTGIIEKLSLTDGEIAAIMGHEIAHALREHGRERMSEELIKQGLLTVLVATGRVDQQYAGALNTVSTLAVTLPHGRGQESESDQMGTELMARAGFNPNEAVTLWQKMKAQGGSKPPEILSTHPADERRIQQIQALLPKVMPLYEAARTQ